MANLTSRTPYYTSSLYQNNVSLDDPVEEEVAMATVDARPIIAAGGEPFDTIMSAVAVLGEREELIVLAPFEPVPLEGVLSSQGFSYDAVDLGAGDWQVTFRRTS